MVALTKDRKTQRREGVSNNDPVAASVKIYYGSIVVLNATGYLAPGSTATGLQARGVAQEQVDNSAGADGDKTLDSEPGIHYFANDGTDTITRAHIGGTAYIVDDQTVASTDGTGTRSAAGEIKDVDSGGVWVQVG